MGEKWKMNEMGNCGDKDDNQTKKKKKKKRGKKRKVIRPVHDYQFGPGKFCLNFAFFKFFFNLIFLS